MKVVFIFHWYFAVPRGTFIHLNSLLHLNSLAKIFAIALKRNLIIYKVFRTLFLECCRANDIKAIHVNTVHHTPLRPNMLLPIHCRYILRTLTYT